MAIFTSPKLVDLIKSNKWKIWQVGNSLLIFLSFFAPWVIMSSGEYNSPPYTGFQELYIYGSIGISFWFDFGRPYVLTYVASGLATLLLYSTFNIILIIFKSKLADKIIWRMLMSFLLIWGIPSLLNVLQLDLYDGFLFLLGVRWGGLLWGGRLCMIGIVSSIFLEIIYFFSKKTSLPLSFSSHNSGAWSQQ